VEQARNENDVVVVSLFVNPAQFSPTEDFDAYPRTWDSDREMIEALKMPSVTVFIPTKHEMYPRGISLDLKDQTGAFVQVLGLSEPVYRSSTLLKRLARRSDQTSFFSRSSNSSHKAVQHRPT
jgi:pantothenate synthetase